MYGFIEIEAFVFGERSQMIVDPAEERLKNEFAACLEKLHTDACLNKNR